MRAIIAKIHVVISRSTRFARPSASLVGWCLVSLMFIFLAPSISLTDVSVSIEGPVALGISGIMPIQVDHHFESGYMTVEREALRSLPIARRREAKRAKHKRHTFKFKPVKHDGPIPYSKLIERIAQEHGVSPALAAAVIKVESGFHPRARSNKGARGLMQVLPATARKVGVNRNIYEPEHNIRAGVKYLKLMLDRYDGDQRLALAAYNAGPGAVDRYRNVPPYRETRHYVPRVLRYYEEYSKHFQDSI